MLEVHSCFVDSGYVRPRAVVLDGRRREVHGCWPALILCLQTIRLSLTRSLLAGPSRTTCGNTSAPHPIQQASESDPPSAAMMRHCRWPAALTVAVLLTAASAQPTPPVSQVRHRIFGEHCVTPMDSRIGDLLDERLAASAGIHRTVATAAVGCSTVCMSIRQ